MDYDDIIYHFDDKKNKNGAYLVEQIDPTFDKIEKLSQTYGILKNNNFYDPKNINLVHHINQALKANLLFLKDVEYIVRDNKIQIIDFKYNLFRTKPIFCWDELCIRHTCINLNIYK